MDTRELIPDGPSPAWARVAILLNLGRLDEARDLGVQVMADTTWLTHGACLGGPRIHGVPDLPVGWVIIDPRMQRAVINSDVLQAFGASAHLYAFMRTGPRQVEPLLRTYDPRAWFTLTRMDKAEARARRAAGITPEDLLAPEPEQD